MKSLKTWLPWLVLNIMLLSPLTSTQPSQCIQYLPSSPSTPSHLHCSTLLTPCYYIDSPLSLATTENQLSILFSQVEAAIANGEIQRECFDGFWSLYCLQSYQVCGRVVDGAFQLGSGGVCAEDCVRVMNEVCGRSQWTYLTNIVTQLRSNGILDLPALMQMEQCNRTDGNRREPCVSLTSDPTSPPDDCMTTPSPSSTSSPPSSPLTPGAIVGICLAVVIILAITTVSFIFLLRTIKSKKSQPRSSSPAKMTEEFDGIAFQHQKEEHMGHKNLRESSGTLMLRQSTVHEALLDVNISPRTTTLAKRIKANSFSSLSPKERFEQLEYPRGNICLVRDLWETNFGPVYMGEASGLDQSQVLTSVFIKSLRDRASPKLKQQFMIEMTWASGFSHPNIISLLGICTKEEPLYMIFEYLEYGSLKEFLQSISSTWFEFDQLLSDTESTNLPDITDTSAAAFGVEDLTAMACQVAAGMEYLAKKAFVLKDLAARNCQVGQNLIVKIANFGLNYDRRSEEYCCIRSHKSTPVPLRWLAPEAIRHNKVSVYSDIWSFGVLLWEVFTFGALPYSKFSNAQVVKHVLSGRVLSRPDKCPQEVYDLMLRCWNGTPNKRPWFSTIRSELADIPGRMDPEEKRAYGGAPGTPDLERALRTNTTAPPKLDHY